MKQPEVLSVEEIIKWQPEKLDEVIGHRVLPEGGRIIFFGPKKSWKSMLTLNLGFCLLDGRPFLGFTVAQKSCLIVQLELSKLQYGARVVKYVKGHGPEPNDCTGLKVYSTYYLKLDRDDGRNQLDRILAEHKPGVLIIDPLYKVVSGKISDDYNVLRLLDNLDRLIESHSISIVIVHHSRKSILDDKGQVIDMGSEDLMGSSYLANWPDSIVKMWKIKEGEVEDWVRVKFTDMRHAEAPIPEMVVRFQRETLGMIGVNPIVKGG